MPGTTRGMRTDNATAQLTWSDHDDAHQGAKVGTFSVTAVETSKIVSFDQPLPDANYQVFLQPDTLVTASFYPSNLTSAGFTVNLSVGVNATFSYLAMEM